MDNHQSSAVSTSSLKTLLSQSPEPVTTIETEGLLQDDLPTDPSAPVSVDEVTIPTETSLSSVISNSLQVVSGVSLEEEQCDSSRESSGVGEAHDTVCDHDSCEELDSKLPSSTEQLKTSELLSEDDLVNVARSFEGASDEWLMQRKRYFNKTTEDSLEPGDPLSPPFQSSFVPSSLTSSQPLTLSSTQPLTLCTPSEPHDNLTHFQQVTNSNNSNSCDHVMISPSLLPNATLSICEMPRKRAKLIKHGQIEVTLEGKSLWDEFYRRGTEMIVNRLGRRMFPGFAVAVSGLKPKVKYSMKVEMILADNHRFKFLNGRWLAVGNAEPQPLSETYIHPDSPNTGAFWMRHGVSFRKLKVTNNKEKPGSNALIHSMHKYYLRLIIDEEFKSPPNQKIPPKTVLQMDFPETSFIAVTAYQNEEVTQLKITNNPFAKAFRESAAEMDWEMIYQQNGIYSPSVHPEMYGGSHMVQSGVWSPQSPMLLPTPLTSTLPPYSPLTGMSPNQGVMGYQNSPGQHTYPQNMTPTAFPGATSSVPGAGSYFQWPQISGQQHRHTTAVTPTASVPSDQLSHSIPSNQLSHSLSSNQVSQSVSSNQMTHSIPSAHRRDSYTPYPHPQYSSAPLQHSSSHHLPHSTLPDFDSAFTGAIGHN